MNDGGRECVENSGKRKTSASGVDAFSQAISRIAVAQIFESVGFQGFQQSALDALSDVAVRYIQEIGKTANLYSNLSGRSQGNVFDVIQGLEDLGAPQGFSGASDVNHCLFSSGAIKEVIRHVTEAGENPFAYSIPKFPVVKEVKRNPSFLQTGENPPEHVPSWLPIFPDSESYSNLNSAEKKEVAQQIEEPKNADKPILISQENPHKAKRVFQCNPFLAPPLQFGEKEASQVSIPVRLCDENHVCTLETFEPATDEPVKSGLVDLEANEKKIIFKSKSSPVQFRLARSRKMENGNDDRKRKAEKILKKSELGMQDFGSTVL